MPYCCDCGISYPKNVFAKSQLKKPADKRRCLGCAAEAEDAGGVSETQQHVSHDIDNSSAARQRPPSRPSQSNPFGGMAARVATMSVSDASNISKQQRKASSSTLELLDSLLEANRMTRDEYDVAKFMLLNPTKQQEDAFLAEWKPFALSLPCRVMFCGLKNRPNLNGRQGTATSWLSDAKRFQVHLSDTQSIAIRPCNLQQVGDGRSAATGRCWDGHAWGPGLLRCDGRLPVHGEVSLIMEGPYPKMTEEARRNLEHYDRKAAACVFTCAGYMHVLKSPALGGTSMLVQSSIVKLEPDLMVTSAFPIGDAGDKILVRGADINNGYSRHLALFSFPNMDLIKLWNEEDGEEFQQNIRQFRLIDYYEGLLATIFVSGELENNQDRELICYEYSDNSDDGSFLSKVASWGLGYDLVQQQDGNTGVICDLCVQSGGVGGRVITLSHNGLVRVWQTDSPAGCIAILNGSLDNLGSPGKVGGLGRADSGPGTVCRVPLVMQEQLARQHDLKDDNLGVITSHNRTLSFWQTSLSEYRAPERVLAMFNPMVSEKINPGLTIDSRLSRGCCIQVGNVSVMSERIGGEWDATQLAIWNPFRKATQIAFEIPDEFDINADSVRFCGGRLLFAGGLADGGLSSASSACSSDHAHGVQTCYVYVVSAREEDTDPFYSRVIPNESKPRMGIESGDVPGILSDMMSTEDMNNDPKGVNLAVCVPHINLPGDPPVQPPEVRPCCFTCHGCGNLTCLGELRPCSGCRGALYCSKKCQKKSWPMHKASCKASQCIKEFLRKQGLSCDRSHRIY